MGTGPYRLSEWKRGSKLVLEAHPGYREAYFRGSGDPADAELVAAMKGRRVPMAGRIEVNIVDEDITRRRLFEKGDLDFVQLRGEVATRPLADGKLKPPYAARGIARHVSVEPFLFSLYFNMKDPVVGGMTHERVALRRAIAMAWDADAAVTVVLSGQAMPAGQMIPPGVTGHDPGQPPTIDMRPQRRERASGPFRIRQARSRRLPHRARRLAADSYADAADRRRLARLPDAVEAQPRCDRTAHRVELAPFQEVIKDLENGMYQMYQDGFGGAPTGYNILAQLRDPAAARQRRAVPQRGIRPGS